MGYKQILFNNSIQKTARTLMQQDAVKTKNIFASLFFPCISAVPERAFIQSKSSKILENVLKHVAYVKPKWKNKSLLKCSEMLSSIF